MKQAILTGPRQSRLDEAELPPLGPEDVVVRVRASGVCASELEPWQSGEAAPLRLGHEVAGEVEAVGERVSRFGIGDRVTGLFTNGFAEQAVTPPIR